MITYKIHLLRTGTTSEGKWRRYVGQRDIPLSEKGRQDLARLKEEYQYPKAERVYSSPLSRCVQTSDILYPGVPRVDLEDLKDMNLGEFEGKTFEELRDNEEFSKWIKNSFVNTPPGGEETSHFTQRIIGAISDIFTEMMEERITDVAVITHGGVIMTLLTTIGLPKLPLHLWSVDNGAGYTLFLTPQMWMRDQSAEVFGLIPTAPLQEEMDMYEFFYNE